MHSNGNWFRLRKHLALRLVHTPKKSIYEQVLWVKLQIYIHILVSYICLYIYLMAAIAVCAELFNQSLRLLKWTEQQRWHWLLFYFVVCFFYCAFFPFIRGKTIKLLNQLKIAHSLCKCHADSRKSWHLNENKVEKRWKWKVARFI